MESKNDTKTWVWFSAIVAVSFFLTVAVMDAVIGSRWGRDSALTEKQKIQKNFLMAITGDPHATEEQKDRYRREWSEFGE